MKVLYGGWLYGNEVEEKELVDIGVRGPMKWREYDSVFGNGIFEYCVCDASVLSKLDERYSEMWSDDFKKALYFFYPPGRRFSKLKKGDLREWDKLNQQGKVEIE